MSIIRMASTLPGTKHYKDKSSASTWTNFWACFLLLPSHIILCVFIFRPALWIKTLLIIDIWIKLCCNGLVISRLVQNAALLLFLFHLHCWHNAALLLVRSRNHNCCTTRQQIWSEPCQKVIHQNGGSPSHRCQERIALFVALQATQKRWQGM